MSKVPTSTIAAILAFSITSLIACLATTVITFALNYSGFNFSTLTVTCNGQTYFARKWAYLYLALRTHTITGLICVCLAIIALIIAAKLYCPLRDLSEEALQKQVLDKQSVVALYILSTCEVLCAISNAGGNISILIDNNSCTIVEKTTFLILMASSMIALLAILLQLVLVIALSCQIEDQEPISLKDVKDNDVAREEDAMSKHLETQMKEYISNNHNQKEEMMEGLLKRDEQIYGGFTVTPQLNQAPSSAVAADYTHHNQPQPASSNAKQKRKKDSKGGEGKKKKRKNIAAIMHKNNASISPQNGGEGYYYGQDNHYNQQDEDDDDSEAESEEHINEQLLHAKFDDNLSQKFDENNFELDYDLNKAIVNDKEEDLSPLQLKELMHLTKDSFALKTTDERGLHLQKKYDIPEDFKININFVQVKDHKQILRDQIKKMIDNPNPAEESRHNEKQEQKKIVQQQDRPVTEQISKLLKVMVFNNSEFYKKQEQKQTQCPISKYVDHDDGFEITQSNEKTGKSKRFDYSKQQLLFSKKRNESKDDSFNEKGNIRQEFNEVEFIKMERKVIFGDDWINQYDRKQENSDKKPNKRRLVQIIRSKYYE